MASLLPLSSYSLTVVPGVPVRAIDENLPVTVRITMAAIDPEPLEDETDSEDEDNDKKKSTTFTPTTLRILKHTSVPTNYLENSDEDSSDDEDEDDEDEEEEEEDEEEEEEKEEKETKKNKKNKNKNNSKDNEKLSKSKSSKGKDVDVEMKSDSEESDNDSNEDSDDDDLDDLNLEEVVLCTLSPQSGYQVPLDLTLFPDEEITFYASGSYVIHLTGNYIDHPFDEEQDDYDSDDEDIYDMNYDDGDDYDLTPDSSDIDDLDNVEEGRIEEIIEEEDIEEDDKKDDKKSAKKNQKSSKRSAEEDLDSLIEKDTSISKKQQKKDHKKNKTDAEKKVAFSEKLEVGPTHKNSDKKTASSTSSDDSKKSKGFQKTTLDNGLVFEDRKSGNGPTAKNGQTVSVRYVGKLASNGKQFDSNTKGKPFKFHLGKGEVIKGWDIGVKGMAVGGERRITIPASLAYGKQSLPGIPANSDLVFDVKLLATN